MIYQTKADRLLVHIAFLLVLTVSAFSHELPMVEPEAVGLSTERLSRIDKVMEMHVAQQKIAGGVTLLARHGKIAHLGVYGMMDVEAEKPMTPDTIFRIASMTKPITSVAVMMLYEEGHFRLHARLKVHSSVQGDACIAAGRCRRFGATYPGNTPDYNLEPADPHGGSHVSLERASRSTIHRCGYHPWTPSR